MKKEGNRQKMKKLIGILAVVMFTASVLFIGNAKAYETLTAQEAYNPKLCSSRPACPVVA